MSQMPPPPPPSQPGQPAPMGGTPSSAGSNKKTYTILAYVLGWITGIIFLFVGKDDPDVKWNAANSIVVFGGISVIEIILGFIPGVHLITNPLLSLIGFVFWLIFLVKAFQGNGERIQAPVIGSFIGPYVDQLANAVK